MSEPLPPPSARPKKGSAPVPVWVSTTYFAEGFPYSLINNVLDILFQQLGATLQVIGLTSLFHLPWNLKFLWGPFVDQYETKRRWLLATEVLLSLGILAMALTVGIHPSQVLLWVSVAALFLAILSATHDISIDGFYLEGLEPRDQAKYVGYRATFYRLAGLSLSGPLLWVVGNTSWFVGLLVVAILMMLLTAFHYFFLPDPESRQQPFVDLVRGVLRLRLLIIAGGLAAVLLFLQHSSWVKSRIDDLSALPVVGDISLTEWAILLLLIGLVGAFVFRRRRAPAEKHASRSEYFGAFSSFMDQPRALLILAFVILFRTGESFLTKMKWPFLNQVVGMSLEDYSFMNGIIGVVASFSATLIGGWMIARWGLRRLIWPFVLSQNVLNLLYMGLAEDPEPARLSLAAVGTVIAVEHAGAGLGTAVFMVLLMRACDPAHKAAHMAILTALMSVSFTIAGAVSGFLAKASGFGFYFGFTFLATIPAMVLIPWFPYLDRGRSEENVPAPEP